MVGGMGTAGIITRLTETVRRWENADPTDANALGDLLAAVRNDIIGIAEQTIDVVFDGPPGHESGRFVEVEDADGRSLSFGQWIDRGDGTWALRFPVLR